MAIGTQSIKTFTQTRVPHPGGDVGQFLVDTGALRPLQLQKAKDSAARQDTTLDQVLIHETGLSAEAVQSAQAHIWAAPSVRLQGGAPLETPDPRLFRVLPTKAWLALGCVPLRNMGAQTVIATWHPERFSAAQARLEPLLGPVTLAIAQRSAVENAILQIDQAALADQAECAVDAKMSCRTMAAHDGTKLASAGILAAILAFIGAPVAVFAVLFAVASLVLVLNSGLKLWLTVLSLGQWARPPGDDTNVTIVRWPTVTILVPLYKENDIAARLIARLGRLDYPPALLDICLIAEERDQATRAALSRADLPSHMRVVVVPHRELRTKPRAMNYAMNTARGSIIGIYDAEDAPEPDQIKKVVTRFHKVGPKVACLQGRLDYYNANANWMARCFTVEYASWFRVMLPGFARVGFPVPLGGTTVFMRRDVLERVGGWDAHNVTEDADLGMRLARAGYRTEVIDTVTREEANCRPLPWIRQRSRWLKGYAMTYMVHMRQPLKLLQELGPVGFAGLQLLFLGTLLGFLMAPLLLSYWLAAFGFVHPASVAFGQDTMRLFWIAFVASELISIFLGAVALKRAGHAKMTAWVPTLHFYFPLASLAMLKALYEIALAPFYWDKTSHGHFDEDAHSTAAE